MPSSTLLPFYSTKTLKFKFPGAALGPTVHPKGEGITYLANKGLLAGRLQFFIHSEKGHKRSF